MAAWLRRTGSSRRPRAKWPNPTGTSSTVTGRRPRNCGPTWAARTKPRWSGWTRRRRARLREALSTFTELGASAVARLTRQRLRALGVRSIPAGPRSATRGDPLGLTRREREVLEEICAGQTNAAIAAKLFISAKTVDHHVSAVLAKLGAPNRNAAASQAAKLGLLA